MEYESTMNITSATFVMMPNSEPTEIQAVIDGQQMSVPMDPANRHYKEILRQTEAKTLVVQEAEEANE